MLPLCDSRTTMVPVNSGMMGCAPAMIPMMPMAPAPLMCPPNMFSTTSMMSEYDSQMYGRFRHVEREHPRYRHAPFDWYRPPKQGHNIVHEDAAVVTLDGPVPIGDFYRHYIYGDYDDYDDYDDDDSDSFESEEYDDTLEPPYEQRTAGYQRYPRRGRGLDDDDIIPGRRPYRPSRGSGNYLAPYPNRQTGTSRTATRPPAYRGTRTLAGDDDFDDTASVNSTYAN